MTDRDYLWCLLHMSLDDEEMLAALCPTCRGEAEQGRCPACGVPVGQVEGLENTRFDREKYERMKGGAKG